MIGESLVSRVNAYADTNSVDLAPHDTGVAELAVFRSTKPTVLSACLYQPVVCLVIQGSKEVHIGEKRHTLRLVSPSS